jgi:ribonuclease III
VGHGHGLARQDEQGMTNRDGFHEARLVLHQWLRETTGASSFPRLDEALTHSSFANESRSKDNQRLEFLGDAVLGLCISEQLALAHPDADEGELTRMRSALVNAEALARWAREVHLGECLAMGRGARSAAERDQMNVLADAVEAVVAAVYEGGGLDAARALVVEITRGALATLETLGARDPKSKLQERVQADGYPAPRYRVTASLGPAHDPTFEVEVFVDEAVLGHGTGKSKRLAERDAAARALEALDAASTDEGGG